MDQYSGIEYATTNESILNLDDAILESPHVVQHISPTSLQPPPYSNQHISPTSLQPSTHSNQHISPTSLPPTPVRPAKRGRGRPKKSEGPVAKRQKNGKNKKKAGPSKTASVTEVVNLVSPEDPSYSSIQERKHQLEMEIRRLNQQQAHQEMHYHMPIPHEHMPIPHQLEPVSSQDYMHQPFSLHTPTTASPTAPTIPAPTIPATTTPAPTIPAPTTSETTTPAPTTSATTTPAPTTSATTTPAPTIPATTSAPTTPASTTPAPTTPAPTTPAPTTPVTTPSPATTQTASAMSMRSPAASPKSRLIIARAKTHKANLPDYERGQTAQHVKTRRAYHQGLAEGWRKGRPNHGEGLENPYPIPDTADILEKYYREKWPFWHREWIADFKRYCPITPADIQNWSKLNTACRTCQVTRNHK